MWEAAPGSDGIAGERHHQRTTWISLPIHSANAGHTSRDLKIGAHVLWRATGGLQVTLFAPYMLVNLTGTRLLFRHKHPSWKVWRKAELVAGQPVLLDMQDDHEARTAVVPQLQREAAARRMRARKAARKWNRSKSGSSGSAAARAGSEERQCEGFSQLAPDAVYVADEALMVDYTEVSSKFTQLQLLPVNEASPSDLSGAGWSSSFRLEGSSSVVSVRRKVWVGSRMDLLRLLARHGLASHLELHQDELLVFGLETGPSTTPLTKVGIAVVAGVRRCVCVCVRDHQSTCVAAPFQMVKLKPRFVLVNASSKAWDVKQVGAEELDYLTVLR